MGGFGRDPIPGITQRPQAPPAREPAPQTPVLRVVNGPCSGRTFPLTSARARVGRGDPPTITVDIDLSECELGSPAMVSRLHAELIWIDGALNVVDLGSRNGTWVADRPVSAAEQGVSDPVPVPPGEKVRFANLELEFIASHDSAALA